MGKGIILLPKHGVNPLIPKCYFCGEDKNEIALLGRLPNDAEAPHGVCIDKEPCNKCQELMKQGILLISVRDGESGDNPYRTGKQAVVTEEAIRRIISPPELCEQICQMRVCYIPDEAWTLMGLPTGEK